jgi:2-polyprenyl-6-methoxyphenol hydroxylase-like FAD-dependent oxidoreductase
MARIPGRVRPHGRFFYFAYWQGLPSSTRARLWFDDPNGIALFPNEDGVNVIVAGVHKSRISDFRANPERAYVETVTSVPGMPSLEGAERVSKLIGKLDVPNVMRPAAGPGIAFVGDAALATDPSMGVGCGWAFQSAEWLVDQTAPALRDGGDVAAALDRYRREFRRRLGLHHWLIAEASSGRPLRANERIAFRAAARDDLVGRALEELATRRVSPIRLMEPRINARILKAGLR